MAQRSEAVGRPGPYSPTDKQVAESGLDWLATRATRQTIKDQIDWLKRQVETRKPRRAGESAA